jgi:two-component system, OmpR family, response regulator
MFHTAVELTLGYKSFLTDSYRARDTAAMNATPHLLIVDDDKDICSLLSKFLADYGYRVSVAGSGDAMMETLANAHIDLVVLDIMLPGKDGLSLCRELRARGRMPIIMLTAIGGEADRIVGLELGADDYLPKPFAARELLARIRAVLRRTTIPLPGSPPGAARVFHFLGWRFDAARRQLTSPAGALVDLRTAEFDILLALVERPQHVLSREQLLDLTRGRATTGFDRAIDVHISRLRRRIRDDPTEPEIIKTVRNGGYAFAAPVTLEGATL